MANSFRRILKKLKYGEDVIVVSGLPRSGTSMFMRMLEAAPVPIMTDNIRQADEDNPYGYFELEAVKNLSASEDKTWVKVARGKAIKVVSHLLKELPDDNYYRIIFARRSLHEIIRSQNIMLDRHSEANPIDDSKAMDLFRKHLANVRFLVRSRPNLEMLEFAYADAVSDPQATADRINRFLGGNLNTQAMATVVDRRLYRNRQEEIREPSQ